MGSEERSGGAIADHGREIPTVKSRDFPIDKRSSDVVK